ncbi:MAG: orotate phosphoribosyltransferase [Bacteroidia bacterium]|nr:MAG: orotate phosphoribosyltransferase [Bacteroidia bacterium]
MISTSQKISELLLEKEAVKINAKQLFKWSSGILSPIYCDNRKMLSYPKERKFIVNAFCDKIKSLQLDCNCIAGVATGGIAWGVLVAETLDLPFVYVRSEPKKHGLGNQIEGFLPENAKVVVIEDLISTGGSSLNACLALQEKGASIQYLISIFQYGFSQASLHFQNYQIPFASLTDFQSLIQYGNFSEEEKNWILQWIENPQKSQE